MNIHTFRLKTGEKLKESLNNYSKKKNLSAAIILSVVGGAKEASIRMPGATPNKQTIKKIKGDFEVVSIEGTLSKHGCHIHISLSDKNGQVVGGHLKEMVVRVTAEVSLLSLNDRKFLRELDEETGFKEVSIK